MTEQQVANSQYTVETLAPLISQGLIAGCKREIETGAVIGDYRYPCRVEDRANYRDLINMMEAGVLDSYPVSIFNMQTGEWESVTHDLAMLNSLTIPLMLHTTEARTKLKEKLAALEQATTVEEVEKISW